MVCVQYLTWLRNPPPSCRAGTNEELQDVLSANKDETNILFHDGTEREIPRPQDEEEQKENYGGKKKRHTVKMQ
jgi:hypothetical protein